MTKTRWLLRTCGLALAVVSLVSATQAAADDVIGVRTCFSKYKRAITELNGDAAAALVDKNTITYYDITLSRARRGKPAEVRQLGPFDMLLVLMVRHNVEPDDLKEMTGRKLFAYGVDDAWTDPESIANIEIQNIQINGTRATAQAAGQAAIMFRFSKEKGKWKFDITGIAEMANAAMAKAFKDAGAKADDAILQVLQVSSEEPVADDIWEPKG